MRPRMRPWIALLALTAFAVPTAAAPQTRPPTPRPLGIAHVTVIDVEHGRRLRDQTIIVEGGRISTVGPSSQVRIPDGYGVVEGRGKFVLPGLIDAHASASGNRRNPATRDGATAAWQRFVPFGVTTTREMAAVDADLGATASGNARDSAGIPVPRRAVSVAVGEGSLAAIRPLGRNRRTDPPPADTTDWAAAWLYDNADWLSEDRAFTDSLSRAMVKRRVALAPMLASEEIMFLGPAGRWRANYPSPTGTAREGARASIDAMMRFVQRFHEAGGTIIAGTGGHPSGGAAIHDELSALVRAGLTPAEALRAATFDAARALRWEGRIGTVTVGKLADLLILGADPLLDVGNAARIEAIMLDGRFIDGAERQRLLDRLAASPNR
jgi:imidazolonepropionase-like amidohydrolase